MASDEPGSSQEDDYGQDTELDGLVPRVRASPTVAFDKALDNILKLGDHDLTLEEDALLVLGKQRRRRYFSCGFCPCGFC